MNRAPRQYVDAELNGFQFRNPVAVAKVRKNPYGTVSDNYTQFIADAGLIGEWQAAMADKGINAFKSRHKISYANWKGQANAMKAKANKIARANDPNFYPNFMKANSKALGRNGAYYEYYATQPAKYKKALKKCKLAPVCQGQFYANMTPETIGRFG